MIPKLSNKSVICLIHFEVKVQHSTVEPIQKKQQAQTK